MGKHLHHIIPKHMNGSNDPSNLIELTIEEHAEAHKQLYEEHGHWQDFIAWKALSGQINSDDLRRELASLANKGRSLSEEHKSKIKSSRRNQKSSGWKWSEESKQRASHSRKGRTCSQEHKLKTSASMKGRDKPKVVCPYCGKIGGLPQMKQWHFDNCKEKL